MSAHHRYKLRDFVFAQLLVTSRKQTSLTQEEMALRIGVSEKSIRNWEAGTYYPSVLNLQKLIELYLHENVFTPGHEQEEARILWDKLHAIIPHRIQSMNEQWFVPLLQAWQALRTSHAPPPEAAAPSGLLEQSPPIPLAALETAPHDAARPASRLLRGDWSEALDVSSWYGRTEELAELEQWLLRDQCRLVIVLGMGGMGKTTLTVKLMQQVASHFDCVLWRSLHNAPSLEEVLRDWIPILSQQRATSLPQELDQSLALLIGLLQERRCLLVLDNLETVFQEGVLGGQCRPGYEGYATLIQRLAETVHRSCLVLTCRELFPDLGMFAGRHAPVRVLKLSGLPVSVSQQMLQDKGLFGEPEAWCDLVQRYAGNPLALKVVAETVRELFGGDITAFLAEGFTTFNGIRQLLAQQFERLSALEQALLYWLAIKREMSTLEALRADLVEPVAKREVMEALHSLRYRSLVERGEQGAVFALQPVILEYVTERFVERVSEEIRVSQPELLLSYALLQGQARGYVRSSQARLLLQPVLDHLLPRVGSLRHLEERLERLLQRLRALPHAEQAYGGGNVVNLLVQLNGHVRGKDCSQLSIWQADLQEAETQDANFAGSDLMGSVFRETISSIFAVALSANGSYVAGGSNTGEIRVWRVMDGQPLLALRGHIRQVSSLAFHPESTLLVSGGYDGLVKVWEMSSGHCLRTLEGHNRWVKSVAFHPAGQLLATGSDDGSIRLWNPTDGRCLKVWQEERGEIWSVAFSPDGQLLASGDAHGIVQVWDLVRERCRWRKVAHHGSPVSSLAFSPDGELLVSGGEDAMILVWEASSGEPLSTLSGHTDAVQSVTFNAEGLLASGSFDGTVKLWQVGRRGAVGQCLSTLQGHTSWVWSVAFGPDGLLASGGHDGAVKLWQTHRQGEGGGKCLRTLQGYACMIIALGFSPDGTLLVSNESNGTTRIWETRSGQCLSVLLRQSPAGSLTLGFSPDGRLFAHSAHAGTIKLWDVKSRQCLRTLKGHLREIWSLVFSPDGRFLASCSVDATIKRWEVSSGRCLSTFEGHSSWVWSLAYSPDGKLLASGDIAGVVKLWEIESGRCLRTLQGSPKAIVALTFTRDGKVLLSSNAQDLVTAWDVDSGNCLKTVSGIGDIYWLSSVALSADGSFLAAESRDQSVKVWNVSSGELLRSFPCPTGQSWSVALSADQRLLACGTDEGTILLWEWQTGKRLMTLRGDRPYERMNISGVTGITEAQKASLKTLGAIEQEDGSQGLRWERG